MDRMAYIARKVCGCMCAATVDDPDSVKTIAKESLAGSMRGSRLSGSLATMCAKIGEPCRCFPVPATREMFVSDNAQDEQWPPGDG